MHPSHSCDVGPDEEKANEVRNTSLLYEIDALLKSDNGEIDVIGVYIQELAVIGPKTIWSSNA